MIADDGHHVGNAPRDDVGRRTVAAATPAAAALQNYLTCTRETVTLKE